MVYFVNGLQSGPVNGVDFLLL